MGACVCVSIQPTNENPPRLKSKNKTPGRPVINLAGKIVFSVLALDFWNSLKPQRKDSFRTLLNPN